MAAEIVKDAKGRVIVNGDAALTAVAPNDVSMPTTHSRAMRCLGKDGEAMQLVFECGGDRYILASTVGKAKTGTMSGFFVFVRAEADAGEPTITQAVMEP